MECDLLINTGSRTARQGEVLRALERSGFVVKKVHSVSRQQPLSTVLSAIKRRRPALLVVGGGDGTVSSILSRLAGEAIEIGIVPLGTTNNFARSLGLPLTIDGAVATIKACKGHPVDLGMLNGMYFANVASIGISADIAHKTTDAAKRRWGRVAYALMGLRSLWTHRPFTVTVEDARRNLTVTLETHQLIVANGRYHAGREIAQDAAIDNGQLLVFALGGISKLSLMKHMLDFYFGSRRRIVHASYYIGRNIRITTSEPHPVEIDGEVKKMTPVRASVERSAIKVRFRR